MTAATERDLAEQRRFEHYAQSFRSVMLRDVKGNIIFWNRAAEKNYGWSKQEAIGTSSHTLLNTIFPAPLAEINAHLLINGFWEGQLIHTLSDGARVKVRSRWELEKNSDSKDACVVETNFAFDQIVPESAHLVRSRSALDRIAETLTQKKWWWITPVLASFVAWELLSELTSHAPILPLIE